MLADTGVGLQDEVNHPPRTQLLWVMQSMSVAVQSNIFRAEG